MNRPLVSWDKICGPVDLGGLGIRKNSTSNLITLGKLCWRMHSADNLASKIIFDKYCEGRDQPKAFKTGFHIWQDMGKGWEIFDKHSGWSLGKGTSINLWHDNWTPFGPLRITVSGPLNLGESDIRVCSFVHQVQWNPHDLSITLPPHL